MKRNLDEWLEAVSVHQVDSYLNETNKNGLNALIDWYGVSTDDDGGIIAYFRDEKDAFRFRLDYINRKLNP
jgi:hypothetical protein